MVSTIWMEKVVQIIKIGSSRVKLRLACKGASSLLHFVSAKANFMSELWGKDAV